MVEIVILDRRSWSSFLVTQDWCPGGGSLFRKPFQELKENETKFQDIGNGC